MPNWNPQQLKAIQTKDKNIMVSASAGSGKTTVLIARLMDLVVKDRVPIDAILAMTFTEAAASEMKKRLAASLQKAYEETKDPEERAYITRQLTSIQTAHISTIHSFCLSILQEYYYMIGLDATRITNIMDNGTMVLYQGEALEEAFQNQYAKQDKVFIDLCAMFSSRSENDEALRKLITSLAVMASSQANSDDWLNALLIPYDNIKHIQDLPIAIQENFFSYLAVECSRYEEGIWDTEEAKTCFDIVAKLAEYTEPTTPANANDDNFTKNQQLVLDNKAIFMPNGTWIVGEMAEAPRADGFKWGFTALPAVKEGGDRYSYTWFEQAWIPAAAEHQDLAKQFIAYLYSDEAAAIFAKAGAIQPIVGLAETLEGDNKMFYSIYDNGAKAALGSFAATEAIEGLDTRSVWFDPVNSLVTGDKTEQDWIDGVKAASDQLRAALK